MWEWVAALLAKFNIALLAKQEWRLLKKPMSMMGHILKARYFPKTGFLNAQLGSNPSLIWRSIWCAWRVLEMGLKWMVGLGELINVQNDYWLLGLLMEKI